LTKKYDSGSTLNRKILDGVDILANNVASTLGPCGRNVMLQEKGKRPIVTKDGVRVAEHIDLNDPFENAGAQIIKQASRQTNIVAGDGTTTATVLARAILRGSQKYLAAGASPVEIKKEIDAAVNIIIENLRKAAQPIGSIEDITHIASISANNDYVIGKLVARAIDCVGKDGSISVEDARSMETSLELLEGFRFDSGYIAGAFINDERRRACMYDSPLILVTDNKIDNIEEILPILEVVAREARPLVIVASDIEGQALAALIMNCMRGTMKIVGVKAPKYGEERRNILKDLCVSTGAAFVSKGTHLKLSGIKLEHLGTCKRIEILKNSTTIIAGCGEEESIDEQIENLKTELEQTDNLIECERIQERITRLASGVAIIHVGAPTEAEMIEKKHRIEDALEAVNAAQLEGIIPGGGVALIRACPKKTKNQPEFHNIVFEASSAPLRQMAKNAGISEDVIFEKVKKARKNMGWDFKSGKMVDMYEVGIVDPVKVTVAALLNAASAAGVLITTNHAIIETSDGS
jgi:chaperonin GroEL